MSEEQRDTSQAEPPLSFCVNRAECGSLFFQFGIEGLGLEVHIGRVICELAL